MILTAEGALLAVALAALVGGLVGAWALLRLGVSRPRRARGKPGAVRRVIVPAGATPKV
jgi:hypothetical protein